MIDFSRVIDDERKKVKGEEEEEEDEIHNVEQKKMK